MTDPKPDPQKRKLYLKLPPELGDGVSFSIFDMAGDGLNQSLKVWMHDTGAKVGDTVTLTIVALTDAECDALPDL